MEKGILAGLSTVPALGWVAEQSDEWVRLP